MNIIKIINSKNVKIDFGHRQRSQKGHYHVRKLQIGKLCFYVTWDTLLRIRSVREIDNRIPMWRRRKLKAIVYDRSGGKCEICGKEQEYQLMETHHVLPVGRFPHLVLAKKNLMCLCHACHKEAHNNPYLWVALMEQKAKEMGIELREYYNIPQQEELLKV